MEWKDLELQLTELRLKEMELREQVLLLIRELHKDGRWKTSGARTLPAYLEKKYSYTPDESRRLSVVVGAILTTQQMVALTPDAQMRVEKLKAWRREEASLQAVAAYRVLTNRCLLAIANANPFTTPELLKIPGIGEKKMEAYGRKILSVLANERAIEPDSERQNGLHEFSPLAPVPLH